VLEKIPGAQTCPGGHARQIASPLFLGAGQKNVATGKRIVRGEGECRRSIVVGNFLDRHRRAERIEAQTSISNWDTNAVQPMCGQYRESLSGKGLFLIADGGARSDMLFDQLPHLLAKRALMIVEMKNSCSLPLLLQELCCNSNVDFVAIFRSDKATSLMQTAKDIGRQGDRSTAGVDD